MTRRISVVVAGDLYANPSLVRPFLEDDGYRIDAEVFDGAELLPAVSGAMPDAVVVNEALLAHRPHVLEDIRLIAPETKVVVIGSLGEEGVAGPDAYLAPGVSLATMSVTIGRLVGDGHLGPSDEDRRGGDHPGGLIRFIASVGLPIVAVWTLIVAVTPRGVAPPAADTTDLAQSVISTPQGTDRLDEAYLALDGLIDAIESGNPVMATIRARTLMEARTGAVATGYLVVDLDAAITTQLESVAGLLSPEAMAQLAGILGGLFPTLPDEATPGGGSVVILGPVIGTDGGSGLPGVADDGSPGGDQGGGGPLVGGGGGPLVGGDGDRVSSVGPGDGKEWGRSHKAEENLKDGPSSRGSGDHGPPPWSNGNMDAGPKGRGNGHGHDGDPPGHVDDGHGKDHTKGKARGRV